MEEKPQPFNLTLPTNGGVSIAMIGAGRSGKSTLMKYVYNKYFKKHITLMFSQNPSADIYKNLPKKVMIIPEFYPELISECHQINSACDNKFPFLMISDDFVSPRIKNDAEITRLLTIYRNANCSSIFSFQGRTLMNAVGRANVNYIAVLKQQTPQEWVNVIKEYLSMWLPMGMTMNEMVKYCQEACIDHQFFFIDNIEGKCYLTKLTKEQAGV